MNAEEIKGAFARHKGEPNVSTKDYFQSHAYSLGKSILSKRKIYLDTRYWIFLRDADMGRAKCPEHTEILQLIRELINSDVALCPISDAAFVETMQQTDEVTRAATAKLMDELSLGVALITEQSRVRIEITHLLEHPMLNENVRPLQEMVWVKACYVLGEAMPVARQFSSQLNRAAQKTSIDYLWRMSLSELTKDSDVIPGFSRAFEKTAEKINVDKVKYAHEIKSIEQAFVAEISGCLDVFKGDLTTLLLAAYKQTAASILPTDEKIEKCANDMHRGLVNAFRFAPKKMAQRIPTLYVNAKCHAAMRWDQGRKFNGHWLLDLHHASAGVGYHDAMFTEKPLRVLLAAGNVALDKEFGMNIFSAERDVINYLKGLQQK
jgi:hypothetical protein